MRTFLGGLIAMLLALGVSVQPASTQGTAPSGAPFRIAWVVGLTGPAGPSQQAGVVGAQMAAKEVNAHGGILGRPVEVVVFDHQFDPSRAVRMMQEDILPQHWDAMYPGAQAAIVTPLLPLVTKAKIISYAPLISADPQALTAANPYFFSVQPAPADAGTAFAQYLQKAGVKKLAIVYQADTYGTGTANAYAAAAKKVGIAVVAEPYDIGTIDITPTLLKVKGENPDRLFAVAFGASAGHVLNSLDKLGWDIPLIGDLTFGLTNLVPLAPPRTWAKLTVQAYHILSYVPPDKRSPRLKTFLAAIQSAGPITQGLVSYSFGWDAVMLTAMAARQARSTDALAMAHALENLKAPERDRLYVSYNEYKFSPTNHVTYAAPGEWLMVPWTPLVDGMVGAK